MTTRIGILSDVHASPAPLAEALHIFAREGVSEIICTGDIAGYHDDLEPTIELLSNAGCRAVAGNHDLKYLARPKDETSHSARSYLAALPHRLELEIEGLSLLVVHASPPAELEGSGIRLLDQQGSIRPERSDEWRERLSGLSSDVLIVGHTHQVFAASLGDVMVVNPGSSVFNHSCAILSLPELTLRNFALGGHDMIKCWNFGMLRT